MGLTKKYLAFRIEPLAFLFFLTLKLNPSIFNCLALPPGCSFFSITVTCQPAFAIKQAAESPAKPLPIITIFFELTW